MNISKSLRGASTHVPTGPIRRRKLGEAVRERLLTLIQNRLEPGDRLPSERELMVDYGVGRPAIREALQSLQSMGLIAVRHGERPRVAEPSMTFAVDQLAPTMRHLLTHSQSTLEHLEQARLLLECHLAAVAAREHRPDDIDRLRGLLEQHRAAIGDSQAFHDLDGEFHTTIAALAGNPILTTTCRATFDWLADFHGPVDFHGDAAFERDRQTLTLQEHEAILAAIASKDATGAADAMTNHLNRADTLYASDNVD